MSVPVVAVIGCGNRAHNILRVTADRGLMQVRYLWDSSDANRRWLNRQHELGARLPDTPEPCFADPDVDAVLITTPQCARRAYVEAAAPTARHIYLDKPVAASPGDVQAIWRLLRGRDRQTATGFSLRYQPGFRRIKGLIAAGVLGEVTQIRACQHLPVRGGMNFVRKWSRHKAASGGFVNEMGIHDIDALIWLSGGVPRAVTAVQEKSLYPPRPDRPRHCTDCSDAQCPYRCAPSAAVPEVRMPIGGLNLSPDMRTDPKAFGLDLCCYNSGHDLFDRGCFAIEMSNGVLATFAFNSCCARGGRDYEIIGSKGMITGNLPSNRFVLHPAFEDEPIPFDERGTAVVSRDGEGLTGDAALFAEFMRHVTMGEPLAADVSNAVLACMTVFAGETSTTERRRVTLTEMMAPDLRESLLGESVA